jgi:hypothetical protein
LNFLDRITLQAGKHDKQGYKSPEGLGDIKGETATFKKSEFRF